MNVEQLGQSSDPVDMMAISRGQGCGSSHARRHVIGGLKHCGEGHKHSFGRFAARQGWVRLGRARRGSAWRGSARQGAAWQGYNMGETSPKAFDSEKQQTIHK